MTIERMWPQARTSVPCPIHGKVLEIVAEKGGKEKIICKERGCTYDHSEH